MDHAAGMMRKGDGIREEAGSRDGSLCISLFPCMVDGSGCWYGLSSVPGSVGLFSPAPPGEA